jgi:hypothetical protein
MNMICGDFKINSAVVMNSANGVLVLVVASTSAISVLIEIHTVLLAFLNDFPSTIAISPVFIAAAAVVVAFGLHNIVVTVVSVPSVVVIVGVGV